MKKLKNRRNVKSDIARIYALQSRRRFLIKHLYLYPFCLAIIYFLSGPFIPFPWIRIIISAALTLFPFYTLVQKLYGKRNMLLRIQSKMLLQTLCTSVSAGYSLESAFLCARPTIEKAFGKRSPMAKALRHIEKSLSAHEPLQEATHHFCMRLDYMELLPIMHSLSITRVVGTGVISILRNSCQMLSELISVRNEVEANNAGKNAEALILCLMPFGVTFALSSFSQDYMSNIQGHPLGIFLMIIAFCIAILSCGLLFNLISDKKTKRALPAIDCKDDSTPFDYFARKVGLLAGRFLPQNYITTQFERFNELSYYPQMLFDHFIARCVLLFTLSLCLSFAYLHFTGYPRLISLLFAILLLVLLHLDVRARAQLRKESLMEQTPIFLSMLVTLLQSGMLLPKAIDACAYAFDDSGALGREIRWIKAQIISGLSASDAIESFSERTPVPEAQSALLLVARYEQSGGTEVLNLLSLQAGACWSLCRNAARKKRERESLSMIFPMMLDFIAVLLVAVTPALISLQI